MTRSPLKSRYFVTVSHGAMKVHELTRPAAHSTAAAPLTLLGRIRLWLRLIWSRDTPDVSALYCAPQSRHNRARARVQTRAIPLSRRSNPLAAIIARVSGRARYLRFIYDYGLIGRYRWCFISWNWRWAKRIFFKENPLGRAAKHAKPYRGFCEAQAKLFPD